MPTEKTKIAVKFAEIKKDICSIFKSLDKTVTKLEFRPVQKIVYGFTTIILIGVATALIALVIRK
jgi:hypothetical protein